MHLLTRHCPRNLLPETSSPKHEYRGKHWGRPVTSSLTFSPWKILFNIIRDSLFISQVKLEICVIFQNFQYGRLSQVATNFFLPDVVPEVHSTSKIAMIISDIWAFVRRLSCNIDGNTSIFKNSLILWPGDIINYFRNTHLYQCNHNLMIPMPRKFNDDIFVRFFSYHDKCCYFIHKGI